MQYLNDFLKIFLTFMIIMDPVGNIPPFFAITGEFDTKTRNLILKKAIIVAGVVLFVFGALGKVLLGFFGISAGAFYISGGILFFTIAYELYDIPRGTTNCPSKRSILWSSTPMYLIDSVIFINMLLF